MKNLAGVQVNSRDAGFTLLEVLISVTLVAMMSVSLWAVFRTSINSWRRGTEFIDTNQRYRTVLDLVRKQMASIYGLVAPIDLRTGGTVFPVFSGTETSMQFVSLNSLRFNEHPGLTMVSYDVINDENGFALVEREARFLGFENFQVSFLELNEVAKSTTIFENLVAFDFEYFDPGGNDRAPQWVSVWDPKEYRRLPAAISMTMTAIDAGGGRYSRHLVIPIHAKPYNPNLRIQDPFEERRNRVNRIRR